MCIVFKDYAILSKRLEYSQILIANDWLVQPSIYKMLGGELYMYGFTDIHFMEIVLGMNYF